MKGFLSTAGAVGSQASVAAAPPPRQPPSTGPAPAEVRVDLPRRTPVPGLQRIAKLLGTVEHTGLLCHHCPAENS